ncbi:MAG: DUF2062 domain-containing protein [Myxococcales bacterium]|nr:DUF2062 domain-containing protein [Myxococcales bacterium]
MISLRSLHEKARAFFRFLLAQHRTPGRVFWALLFGFVIGCTPLFGVQIFLCVAVAYLLGLNFVIVYGAANISIPPLSPFIGLAAVKLGELIRQGRWVALSRGDFLSLSPFALAKRFFVAWLIGGTLLGMAIGFVVGGMTYVVLRRRQARHAQEPLSQEDQADLAIEAALARAAARYRGAIPRYRFYARMKYRLDPVYRELLSRIPPGAHTVDVGCGQGLLGTALAELGEGRSCHGIDWDAVKIAAAQQAAASRSAVTLQTGDARTAELPACDAVALIDMLHYYDADTQRVLLARASSALRPGGQILLRETDPERASGRTRFFERLMVYFGWNRAPQVHYRPLSALRADLEALGLAVEQCDVAGSTHPGNVLLQAQKPHSTATS